jgi:SIR2-like domain
VYPNRPPTEPLPKRLQEAVDLPPETWEAAEKLAAQLEDKAILPLVGAGASCDCGQPVARVVSEDMFSQFEDLVANVGVEMPVDVEEEKEDLGLVADALYLHGGQSAAVGALSLVDKTKWPAEGKIEDHFCGYRVLARLIREGVFSEAISLNYDCGFERGLTDEGFRSDPTTFRGTKWLDHATVITSAKDHASADRRGEMVLAKAHGCAATYRREMAAVLAGTTPPEKLREAQEKLREEVIVRREQLMDWRSDFWARDLFADRVRSHVVLLLGVSGQDPVIHIALTRILQEIYENQADGGQGPRVIAIDKRPRTVALESLVHQGCGCKDPPSDMVVQVEVPEKSSMTSVIIILAVEMLARRLAAQGVTLPSDRAERVLTTMVDLPASLRWSYRLERRNYGFEYAQRINLEMSGGKGYVPVGTMSDRATRALKTRALLVGTLNLLPQAVEGIDSTGFLLDTRRGKGFLPLGITKDELEAVPRIDLGAAAKELRVPDEVDPLLVVRHGDQLLFRSAKTGKMLKVK